MRKINILVTGVGGNIGQGVIKAIKRSSLDCNIIGVDCNPLSAGLFVLYKGYVVPSADSNDLFCALVKIICDESIDILLVSSDQELDFYAHNKNLLESETGVKIIVSSEDTVRIANDKLLTAEFLKQNKFPYAESVLYADQDGLSSFVEMYPFPLIIKPRKGGGSKDVFIVSSIDELHVFGKRIENAVVQTVIGESNSEYTAAALYFEECSLFESIIFRRELHNGTTYRAEVVKNEEMTEQIYNIVSRLKVYGPCNIQYKFVEDKVVTFEVNPRFSGTTAMRCLVGFNDVEIVLNYVMFNKLPQEIKIENATFLRYWNELVVFDSLNNIRNKKIISNTNSVVNNIF